MTGDFDQLKLILRGTTVWLGVLTSILVSLNAAAAPQNETVRGPEPAGGESATAPVSTEQPGSTATPDLGAVREWLANGPLAPRCKLAQLMVFAGKVYAACASDGLLVIAAGPEPELLEQRDLGGSVVELFERDGELCARVLKSTDTVVVSPSSARTQQPIEQELRQRRGTSPPKPPKRKRHTDGWGRVLDRDDDTVIVDLGSDDGVEVGERMEFAAVPRATVGVVRAVAKRRARVQLGQNEDVPLGSGARVSALHPSASTTAPPRAHELTSLSLLARPFLGLDNPGGGIIVDAAVSRRLSAPFKLSAVVAPFGFGAAGGHSATTFTGYVLPSYDAQLFEAGIGLGVQTVSVSDHDHYYDTGTGTLVPVFVRLGASDGLSLAGRVDITLFHQSFFATGARVEFVFPVSSGNWLLLNGVGGLSGYAELELGLRTQLHGNGNRGSHYLTLVVGGSEVSSQRCVRTLEGPGCIYEPRVSGAHFGFGFESRL